MIGRREDAREVEVHSQSRYSEPAPRPAIGVRQVFARTALPPGVTD
jgi:hypothetical protein